MIISSIGLNLNQLAHHGQIIHRFDGVYDRGLSLYLQGIDNYPLSPPQKKFLMQRLQTTEDVAFLLRLYNPTIILYRWSNGQLRYFLITQRHHLVEDPSQFAFYRYFPFLRFEKNSLLFDVEHLTTTSLPVKLAWLPQSFNYTHFLSDSLGPWSIFADLLLPHVDSAFVPLFDSIPNWQKQILQFFPFAYLPLIGPQPSKLAIIKPRELLVPIASSTIHSQLSLRKYLHQSLPGLFENDLLARQPLFMTRSGLSACRIRNSGELEEVVRARGGQSFDPSRLSLVDKISVFRSASLSIGDGSASMNHILFAPLDSQYIGLTDPESIANPDYLVGGWPYTHSICHRYHPLIGTNPVHLQHSPLCSSVYSPIELASLLDRMMDSFV